VRLPRDHYVRLAGNDYSVHPSVIGRKVHVTAGLDRVRVRCEGALVAEHERCWATHQTITDPEHAHAAAALRHARLRVAPAPAATEVQQRPLTDYDRLFGLDTEGVA
jgi:hypothetical protein